MNVHWLIFSYHLVVLYGFYATVQGVEFPLTINELVIETVSGTSISYDKSNAAHIMITRSMSRENWLDVWTHSIPDSSAEESLMELKDHDYKITFGIQDLFSFAANTFTGHCYGSLSPLPLYLRLVINSRKNARSFLLEEIFAKLFDPTKFINMGITYTRLFELNQVLVYINGEVKRVARNAILDSMLIEDSGETIRHHFLIHPSNDNNRRFIDVLFTAQFFKIGVSYAQDRVVLGIWMTDQILTYICLIFDNDGERVQVFYNTMSSFQSQFLFIDEDKANSLFNADLENIEDIPS